jgi:hypothetical protein
VRILAQILDKPVASVKAPLKATPQSKRGCYGETLSEVEEIVKKLEEKHGAAYLVEKLNIWAHMLHIKKHDSYDQLPNVPYFTTRDHNRSEVEVSYSTVPPVSAPLPVSPGKSVTECIDQLRKWHSLLNEEIITLQETILKDML